MAINQHYNEVLDMLDHLFVYMFNGLKKHCGVPSAAVQYQAQYHAFHHISAVTSVLN